MRTKDDDKRIRIFRAAIHVINERGLAGASVARIAAAAGVSPATLYVHFENKDDMLNKLFIGIYYRMSASLRAALDDTRPPRAALYEVWRAMWTYLREQPEDFLFVEQFGNNPVITEASREQVMDFFEFLHRYYRRLMDDGVLRPLTKEVISACLFMPMINLVKWQMGGKTTVDEEAIRQSFEVAWRGLVTDEYRLRRED
ncbi:TetR/AcrR family transcriptional regulator [Hahella sp. SMD15-11]|uniref:TetR/AcrR family transcriptional regulator n=1 Tax=Thermohahella caldifontis TaxID=3142973 RepID=A0AB39US95_9GAMM